MKVPAWLNDPTNYHNRGDTTYAGESSTYGDFGGLDDLFTEQPDVVEGMTDIYKTWVDFGIDGFRIDTVKHVNLEFWQQFAPAIRDHASDIGNDDFFAFGEVFDGNPSYLSTFTTEGRLDATLDFGFQGAGLDFAKGLPTTRLRNFYASDDLYTDTDSNAYSLPTFLGNHDMGRVGGFLDDTFSGDELLRRDELAHALMYLTRGQPVVYYGDEQGFTGDGGDKDARQDMFASRVASYNDDDLIGTPATTATPSYRRGHPLYRTIASLAELREAHPALADGAQLHRYASNGAGVYAFSRIGADEDREYVVAVNNATTAKTVSFATLVENGALPAGVAGHPRDPARRRRGPGLPDRAAAVRGRLPGRCPAARARGRTGRALRQPERGRGGRARGGAGRGGRVGSRRRVQPGLLRVAAGRWRLAAARHGRQRAVPGLPRPGRPAPAHHAGVPRGAARQQRQPVGDLHLGDRRGPGRR